LPVALYNYRCAKCGRLFATETRADKSTCPDCKGQAVRRYNFYTAVSMKEHWNQAVGQYVSNRSEMTDALKRQSEEASVRTGIDHEFELVEPSEMADAKAHGVDEDTLEESRRRRFDP
jgi:predicted  nucleic acid-binding Zn-ribbon protein